MASNYDQIRQENLREYGEGTRHLAFLGRLYSDRTHFIYELLQNAEDKDAKSIQISLYRDRLELLHDGTPFSEADIRGICGVGEGTKSEDLTKIGKFGIGFKSVYAYTLSPEIHCGDEHFRIKNYVRPYGIDSVQVSALWTTRFIFPFDRSSVSADSAFEEIAERLAALNVQTLLFLREITEIHWQTDAGGEGIYLRETNSRGPGRQVTVIGQTKGREDEEESWLVFDRPVNAPDCSPTKPVEIAYRLERGKQGKSKPKESIIPLHNSPLFVFFATEKDTRLGFLIQGPYKTTPARDNIPRDDPWNTHLLEETAELVVDSLRHLKSMTLLQVGVLEAMPIQEEDFLPDSMFRKIYDGVAKALVEEKFLPDEAGGFLSAQEARIGRGAEIRGLLSAAQLKELFNEQDAIDSFTTSEVKWLSGSITQQQTPLLRGYLIKQLGVEEVTPESFARRVTDKFFQKQADEWLVKLYKFLLKQEALWRASISPLFSGGPMRHRSFVRLEDGSQVSAFGDDGSIAVYLPGKVGKRLPCIKSSLLVDKETREFFARLGVREPDVVSEVIEHILPVYGPDKVRVSDEEHADHISLILQALEVDSVERRRILINKLRESYFLFVMNAATGKQARAKPKSVYLKTPGLEIFLGGNPDAWLLDERYGQAEKNVFIEVGVRDDLRIVQREADRKGYVTVHRTHGWHKRGIDGFDPECWVEHLDFALGHLTDERSLFIWQNIARPLQRQVRGTVEKSTRQTYDESETELTLSKLGRELLATAWLPDGKGGFHKPEECSLVDLPEDFERDEGLASQLRMRGSELTNLARKAGLDVGDLDLIRELKGMPEEFQHLKQLIEKRRAKPTFPERPSPDPARRLRRSMSQAHEAPRKEFEERPRNVRTSSPTGDKVTYLRQSYTNEESELVCQMCEQEMPFRRRDGEYYFEAVQLFNDLAGEYASGYLALCPLCAAKFKELVKRDEKRYRRLRDQIVSAEELQFGLEFGKELGSIRFVEKHLLDIKGLLAEEDETSERGSPRLIDELSRDTSESPH